MPPPCSAASFSPFFALVSDGDVQVALEGEAEQAEAYMARVEAFEKAEQRRLDAALPPPSSDGTLEAARCPPPRCCPHRLSSADRPLHLIALFTPPAAILCVEPAKGSAEVDADGDVDAENDADGDDADGETTRGRRSVRASPGWGLPSAAWPGRVLTVCRSFCHGCPV